jgi:predicted nucleotidyltransferase
MNIKAILEQKREDIFRLAAKYGAFNVRIFGSAVRNEEGPKSDIDLLVEMEPDRSLFDLGGLQDELQSLLGCEVDIVTEKGLHWYIRDQVINEARQL